MSAGMNLTIDRLRIRFEDVGGQEHRLKAISARSAAILQAMVQQRLVEAGIDVTGRHVADLAAGPVKADLARERDEVVARRLAEAAYLALTTALGI
jgi:hypothetical protein